MRTCGFDPILIDQIFEGGSAGGSSGASLVYGEGKKVNVREGMWMYIYTFRYTEREASNNAIDRWMPIPI